MNYIKTNIVVILMFIAILVITLINTDTRPDAISEIDNKTLADSPMHSIGTSDFPAAVDNYLNDRIGFRYDYIKWYEKAHDVIFGMLIHPSYMYGQDKEIFASFDLDYFDDENYLSDFADFVQGMQKYCNDRGIQFVFQWEPDKSAIKTELLPRGLYYDSSWVDYLFGEFDERNINYVDNITLMNRLDDEGVLVYNHRYDTGHFNDNGAYYSVNNVLENLRRSNTTIHVNNPSEIDFGTTIIEKLDQSEFSINEEVPSNEIKEASFKEIKEYVDDIYIDPSTQGYLFSYYENDKRQKEGAPKGLVFGGSHMGLNYKYYANSFSEYLNVPNYTNVINYEYYIEKFNPRVVVFEMCQRTTGDFYFPIYRKEELKADIEAYEASRY